VSVSNVNIPIEMLTATKARIAMVHLEDASIRGIDQIWVYLKTLPMKVKSVEYSQRDDFVHITWETPKCES
jgi:hypothetical protein